jgi:four helix bundle protein
MNEAQFKERTKSVALRVIRLVDSLPRNRSADVIGRQLLRSATSVGANYRAACRAKSRKDMVAKLGLIEEEADESIYWLELIVESALMQKGRLTALLDELNEILSMVVASQKTMRRAAIQDPRSKIKIGSRRAAIQNPKSKI